jgi:CRP/FNR family transcriptional regulator, cyclic AMP receptor protein
MSAQAHRSSPDVIDRSPVMVSGRVEALPPATGPDLPPAADPLAGIDLFDDLDPTIRHHLITAALPRRFRRGEVIFTAGSLSDELLLLMSGTAVLFRGTSVRRRAVLAAVCAPGVLGEEVLAGDVARVASAEAVRDSFALALPGPALGVLMRRHPAMAEAARWWLVSKLARLVEQHADDVLLDLPGRVAKTLIRFADDNLTAAVVDISQGTLANLARASRQSVNQTLRGFASRGWLHVEPGKIIITDIRAVRRRAGVEE